MISNYHNPVLLHTCLEGLAVKPDGIYVDATYGGGGHAKEILKQLGNGKLIGFDQDPDSIQNIPEDDRFIFVNQNFRFLKNHLRLHKINFVDGILADLGVSSHQFDTPQRGFSIRLDGALDMRMNPGSKISAETIVNDYSEVELARVLWEYGELRNSKLIAEKLIKEREMKRIESTDRFKGIVEKLAPKNRANQFLARVFQAIRIEVNQEIDVLKDFLLQCTDVIKPGGRLVVISYHSLEDRLVKNLIRSGNFENNMQKDFYGNIAKPFQAINTKVITPSAEEISLNPRARSAKLRIAERINEQQEN